MRVRVEYRYDDESRNWNFRVPALGINGSTDTADTQGEAEQEALAAIEFMLEAEGERLARPGGDVSYILLTAQSGRDEVSVASR